MAKIYETFHHDIKSILLHAYQSIPSPSHIPIDKLFISFFRGGGGANLLRNRRILFDETLIELLDTDVVLKGYSA